MTVHLLADAIWVGGLVTLVVVSSAARKTLDEPSRVAFFRALGRRYGVVAGSALVVALATGWLLAGSPARWSGWLWAAVALSAALVVATIVGVVQARAITRLRQSALNGPAGEAPGVALRRKVAAARLLRSAIALLTLAVVAVAAHHVG